MFTKLVITITLTLYYIICCKVACTYNYCYVTPIVYFILHSYCLETAPNYSLPHWERHYRNQMVLKYTNEVLHTSTYYIITKYFYCFSLFSFFEVYRIVFNSFHRTYSVFKDSIFYVSLILQSLLFVCFKSVFKVSVIGVTICNILQFLERNALI